MIAIIMERPEHNTEVMLSFYVADDGGLETKICTSDSVTAY